MYFIYFNLSYRLDMETHDKEPETTVIAKLSRIVFISFSLFVGVALIVVGSLIKIDSLHPINQITQTVFLAIGTSVVSSVLFYLLYSWTAEERVLNNVSEKVTKKALKFAHELYIKNYQYLLPAKLYPETDFPLKEYNDHFDDLLSKSSIYYCKSFAAEYLTYRLKSNSDLFTGKDLKIMIADPKIERILKCRAQMSIKKSNVGPISSNELTDEIDRVKKEIFTTLYSLYACRCSKATEVYFHDEYPFSRVEFFEQGMFITYYYGGEYPHTYFYEKSTFIYSAHLLYFRQNFENQNTPLTFNEHLTEKNFKKEFQKYRCELSLNELNDLMENRISKFSGR